MFEIANYSSHGLFQKTTVTQVLEKFPPCTKHEGPLACSKVRTTVSYREPCTFLIHFNLFFNSRLYPPSNHVGGWTILKCTLERKDGMVGTRSNWLRIRTSEGLL
jgi:hypothetical protein